MTLRPDAVRRTHSVWFHFTKEPRYFSGIDEIREPYSPASLETYARNGLPGRPERHIRSALNPALGYNENTGANVDDWQGNPLGRLPNSVWTLPPDLDVYSASELDAADQVTLSEDIMPTAPLRPDATVDYQDEQVAVIRHDARQLPLEDGSVDLIVTSPPYFALRSYRDDGEHYDGQIGSEDTPDLFLDALDECMTEWGRVLKPSGSVWINLGDKYVSQGSGHRFSYSDPEKAKASRGGIKGQGETIDVDEATTGVRAKSLIGLPWRFAIRQIDAGWILRAEVIWDKPHGLPESVTDRVRRSHEQWFHFVKEPRYFSGVDEIREPQKYPDHSSIGKDPNPEGTRWAGRQLESGARGDDRAIRTLDPLGRLPGSVWQIPSEPLLIPDDTRQLLDLPDHFAAFPQEWPRRIITGWAPTGICSVCGEGRRPVVNVEYEQYADRATNRRVTGTEALGDSGHGRPGSAEAPHGDAHALRSIERYACACPTPDAPTTPAVILDPFGGTGTVAGVAKTLGRFGISNDLSESYNRLTIWRITQSGHFTKTEQRAWADRQGQLL